MKNRKRTLEGRLDVASTKAQGALDIFETAAQQLEKAADEAHEVTNEAEVELMRVQAVRDNAAAQRRSFESKASKIRELFQ